MADEWDDIEKQNPAEEPEEELGEDAVASGKFDKLLGSDSRKYKLSGMFKEWYLDYASYTILDRAVPHIVDGFKPVQRRVLHTMFTMDDGRYTKVANIVGQAMQYHPHGDASILGALVTLGQKGLLIDCQGNWGNILTGDSNAAPRYIEARLSKFAKEVVFDPKVTPWMTSYDGRNQEPTELPVRFPLLLAQGTEGIAAGLSSKILPHNFNELLDASVAILKGEPYTLLPDFPTGGIADCSKYNQGKRGGMVKVRARINKVDKNTITITEIPFGKTSQAIIDSIIKAKEKKKINIKKIDDMTTDKVEIIIHLPADVSPDKTIDALYAFTECETKIAPNACVIRENKPAFLTVNEILEYDTFHTRDILQAELEVKLGELENEWHYSSLERIFFENRIYKVLEMNQKTWEEQLEDIMSQMKQYQDLLRREILMEDILRLVEKPVRKISKFDTKALDEKIYALEDQMKEVKDHLEHITEYTIDWFRNLKKKYGKQWPRLTEISSLENITVTKVVSNNAKLYANLAEGFVGIGLKRDDGGEFMGECSDLSEIIVIGRDGKYRVTKVSEKAFFGKDLLYAGVFNRGDERTIYNVIYRDGKGPAHYAKRFNITSITRDKEYDITTGAPESKILWFTVNHNGEAETVRIQLRPKKGLKKTQLEWDFASLAIKGRGSRGNLVTKNPIARIQLKSKGVTTLEGKDRHPAPQRRGSRTASGQIHRTGQGAGHLCRRNLLHHLLRAGEQVPGRRGADREIRPCARVHRPLLGQRRQSLLRQALQLHRKQQHPAPVHLRRPRLQAGGHIGRQAPPDYPHLRRQVRAPGGRDGGRGRIHRQEGPHRQGQEMLLHGPEEGGIRRTAGERGRQGARGRSPLRGTHRRGGRLHGR